MSLQTNTIMEFLPYSQKATLLKISLYIFLLLLLVFIANLASAPLSKFKEMKQVVLADSLFVERFKEEYNQKNISPLIREIAYKESLLELSKNDSIQLVLDLVDSTAHLAINGVIIHTNKIEDLEIDPLLRKLPNLVYLHIFSKPLRFVKETATIIKEPIVERQAPKDSLEASRNAYQPDTLIQNPAFINITLERGITLIIDQNEDPIFEDKWEQFKFHNEEAFELFKAKIYRFVTFQSSEYHTSIKMKMPASDIRAIYRAIPTNAKVVLRY
ncbi:MAG: hypothetical protein ACJA08_001016 [Cyclobacteriaceae bacterium]